MADDLPGEIAELARTDEAVVVVDGNEGVILAMSPAAEELLGIGAPDIVGEFVEMLVPDKMRWGHQAYRRGYLAEPRERDMDPGLKPHAQRPLDETLVPIAVRLVPHRVDGRLYVAAHVTARPEDG